ncbi:MAG: transposase [Pseudonocardiales bacterium]|nr:transposase [Pseudonocardiales bacterium]
MDPVTRIRTQPLYQVAARPAFHAARHLTSWAGICPGHHESAGERKSGRTATATGGSSVSRGCVNRGPASRRLHADDRRPTRYGIERAAGPKQQVSRQVMT